VDGCLGKKGEAIFRQMNTTFITAIRQPASIAGFAGTFALKLVGQVHIAGLLNGGKLGG